MLKLEIPINGIFPFLAGGSVEEISLLLFPIYLSIFRNKTLTKILKCFQIQSYRDPNLSRVQ